MFYKILIIIILISTFFINADGLTIDIKKREVFVNIQILGNNEKIINIISDNFNKIKKVKVNDNESTKRIFSVRENTSNYALTYKGETTHFLKDDIYSDGNNISDAIYKYLFAEKSFFNEKLTFVQKSNGKYILSVANYDGNNKKDVLVSTKPILSPDISNDGRLLTYVSFEDVRPAIFLHNISTKKRIKITNFKGVHSDPKFSKDDNKIIMSLSKDGDADLYTYDINKKMLSKITNELGNEVSPEWADNESFLFSSDKLGAPNVYYFNRKNNKTKKIFKSENYTLSPIYNNNHTFAVYMSGGFYGIIKKDNESKKEDNIIKDFYIESPSISKNGTLIVYATKENDKYILKFIDTNGNDIYTLRYQNSDIIEPSF